MPGPGERSWGRVRRWAGERTQGVGIGEIRESICDDSFGKGQDAAYIGIGGKNACISVQKAGVKLLAVDGGVECEEQAGDVCNIVFFDNISISRAFVFERLEKPLGMIGLVDERESGGA